ncbi:MAG: hypothetical protein KAR42_17875, partial [candidate division Zixibacteria bacterium]|nr:hypothetical protein [candidate division Zixibacteria bacterium]
MDDLERLQRSTRRTATHPIAKAPVVCVHQKRKSKFQTLKMSNPDEYTKGRKSVVDEIKRYLSEEIEISATRLTKLARMQKDCLTHFRRTYPKFKHRLIAIPNIGTRNALSREQHLIGMSVGTAHLFLAVPRNGFAGLYFLFKRKDKHITTAQAKFRTE